MMSIRTAHQLHETRKPTKHNKINIRCDESYSGLLGSCCVVCGTWLSMFRRNMPSPFSGENMTTVCSSESELTTYHTTRHHDPEDHNIKLPCLWNPKFHNGESVDQQYPFVFRPSRRSASFRVVRFNIPHYILVFPWDVLVSVRHISQSGCPLKLVIPSSVYRYLSALHIKVFSDITPCRLMKLPRFRRMVLPLSLQVFEEFGVKTVNYACV
jgi:hypothetical protein